MGQYYKAINLNNSEDFRDMEFVQPDSMKLMEHSWVGNNFVGTIMNLMTHGNPWHKSQVVWAGDYYDEDGEIDYYSIVPKKGKKMKVIEPLSEKQQRSCFLINYSKNQYVSYAKLPRGKDGWMVNPLPLLTALGNGRGGGDYFEGKPDFDKVGIWAKDILAIDFVVPDGFEELVVRFIG